MRTSFGLFEKRYAQVVGSQPFETGEVPVRGYFKCARTYRDQFDQPIEGLPIGEVMEMAYTEWYGPLRDCLERWERVPDEPM